MFSKWKCGNCGRVYSFNQYLNLPQIKLVEEDTHPERQHGYTSVCELCGYRFHIDKWLLHNYVNINTEKGIIEIKVSSTFLELNHSDEEEDELWYETMVFPQSKWLECGYQNRYKTKEEALKDHNRILELLKNGKYNLEKLDWNDQYDDQYELIIYNSEGKEDVVYKFLKLIRSAQNRQRRGEYGILT